MKKRILSMIVLLAVLLTCVAQFAFGEGEPEVRTQADYQQVEQSFDKAEKQAEQAGVIDAVEGKIVSVVDETLAAVNEQLAEDLVDNAQKTDQLGQTVMDALADRAEDNQADAEAARDAAVADAHTAVKDAVIASVAENIAEDAAQTADETHSLSEAKNATATAETAAAIADQAADEAQGAAISAIGNAFVAKVNADQAELDYQLALAAYEETKVAVEAQLALGQITAEIAVQLTEAAEKEAQRRLDIATQARKNAEAAEAAQKEVVEQAKEELKDATVELEKVVAENAVEVAKDTAIVAATGLALEAAKLASDTADNIVDYYQVQYDDLKAQVGELDEKIEACNAAIIQADLELVALSLQKKMDNGIFYDVDGEYQKALANVEAAKQALAEAERIKANAEALIKLKEAAALDYKTNMEALQTKIKKGSGYEQTDVDSLTQIIFTNLPAYGVSSDNFKSVTPVPGEAGIYSAVILVDGGEQTIYFKASVEGGKNKSVVQYYRAEQKPGKELTSTNDLTKYVGAHNELQVGDVTKLVVTEDSTTYEVKAVSNGKGGVALKVVYNGTEYDIQKSAFGGLCFKTSNKLKDVHYITVFDPDQFTYISAENPVLNSNAISNVWEQLNDVDQNVIDKTNALNKAKEDFEKEWSDYDKLVKTVEENQAQKAEYQKQLEETGLKDQLEALDKKLNGNLGSRIITALIKTNGSEFLEMIATGKMDLETLRSLIENGWDSIKDELSGEGLLDVLGGIGDALSQTGSISQAIIGVTDGDITGDDVKAILELLSGDIISLKMRQAILQTIEDLAQAEFDKAKDNLENAVKKAEQEIADQGKVVLEKTADLAKEELIYLATEAELAKAKLEEANAKLLEKQAEEAAAAAKKAYDDLQELRNKPIDDTKLKEAEAAYEAAQKAADEAAEAARVAVMAAVVAREQAIEAAKQAEYAKAAYKDLRDSLRKTLLKDTPDIDFDALKEQNPDVIAWIIVPDTCINYPIVQGTDNEFYTNHLFEGEENEAGCIFLDTACKPDFSSANSVLYGNNIEGEMFGDLTKFLKSGFLKDHKEAQIITPDETFTVVLDDAKKVDAADESFKDQSGEGCKVTLTTFADDKQTKRVVVTGTIQE